jgi:HEPN domain-containing protein
MVSLGSGAIQYLIFFINTLRNMPQRTEDWLKQAKRDLEHARMDIKEGFYEWACFSAQQASEKALKALYQNMNALAWGHSVRELLQNLNDKFEIEHLMEGGKILDKYYIPARYPNGFETGAPMEYFTLKEAKEAVEYADKIIRFCENNIS